MNNHHIVWMYAQSKHAETLQEIERYRLVKQAKNKRREDRQRADVSLKALTKRVQSLISCVQFAPQGQKLVCLR